MSYPPTDLFVCNTRDLVTKTSQRFIPAGCIGRVLETTPQNQLIIQFAGLETVHILDPNDSRIRIAVSEVI